MSIRTATPDDRARVVQLLQDAYGEYEPVLGPALWEQYWPTLDPSADDLGLTFVVEEGTDIVGTARLSPPSADNVGAARLSPPSADAVEVRAVAVAPDHRGAGIARLLMAEAERRARDRGATALTLHTTDFMARAKQLYERLGYRREPETDFVAVDPSGTRADVHILGFRLPLAPEA